MEQPGNELDSPAAEAGPPADIESNLLAYLAGHLDVARLTYAEAPEQITHGWETFIYSFRLTGNGLSPSWQGPLILRVYPGQDAASQAERETSVQQFVHENGYPAPLPLAVEVERAALGVPFMIMERVAGVPMLDTVTGNPLGVLGLARNMADKHAALHQLPISGCPLSLDGGTLVERRLANLEQTINELPVRLPAEVLQALEWLKDNQSVVIPEDISVCHQDFHPLNLMVDENGAMSVIDWSGAALGDRHADIASTLVLVRAPPIAPPDGWLERILIRFGGPILAWLYLRRYRSQLPIDADRLRYWEALNVFHWWSRLATFELVDPGALGLKGDVGERIRDGQLKRMRDYFLRLSGPLEEL